MERLYCPDFSSVFGPEFTNPFLLPTIDSQIWPIFVDFKFPEQVINLLAQKTEDIAHFYHRKITLAQQKLELQSSSIQMGLLQSLEIDSKISIPNEFVIDIAQKWKNSRIICSISSKKDGFSHLKELVKKHKKLVAGVVLYPKYQMEYIISSEFSSFLQWITKNKLFLKLDFTNLHFSKIPIKEVEIPKVISAVLNIQPDLPVVIVPGDSPSIQLISDRYKYQRNTFIELNLRILGGQSPTNFFKEVFDLPGFIQNWWYRVVLGSGSPTLESSQLVRGWYEATEGLSLKFRSILRMWGFRNITRLLRLKPLESQFVPLISSNVKSESDNQNTMHLGYNIVIQSFAITQLISIQDEFLNIVSKVLKKYPNINSGRVTLKSYHTTTSLVVNEHEIGNYLDLHYYFVNECKKDSSESLHTVAAKENRADFNSPDHIIASTHGHRSITYHIRDGELSRGSRENIYALATFGPRKITIALDILLY